MLAYLVETISGMDLHIKTLDEPKNKYQRIENLNLVLHFLKKEGIKATYGPMGKIRKFIINC